MSSMKMQKDWRLSELLRQIVAHILLENGGEIPPERVKRWSQQENNAQLDVTSDGTQVQC